MSIYVISLLVLLQIVDIGKAAKRVFMCTSGEEPAIGSRSFLLNLQMHWPGGVVPYEMDPKFSGKQVQTIKHNMQIFKTVSCVKWEPRKSQEDYVQIKHTNSSGVCRSAVGRRGRSQPIYLGDDCFDYEKGYLGAILHEMMHALGFIHEQQRLDRDCYVKVYSWATLEKPYDFAVTQETSTSFPYDIGSIMHYGTSTKMESLTEKEELGNFFGELTKLDILKLNFMYCGGKSYCELDPADCQRMKEAEKRCVIKPGGKGKVVSHQYKGKNYNPNKYRVRSLSNYK